MEDKEKKSQEDMVKEAVEEAKERQQKLSKDEAEEVRRQKKFLKRQEAADRGSEEEEKALQKILRQEG